MANELKFDKTQILNSKKYIDKRDILNSILDENNLYSLKEVDKLIEKFMKMKVN